MIKKIIIVFVLCYVSSSALSQKTRKYTVILRSNVGTINLWDGSSTRTFGFAPSLSAESTLPALTLYAEEGDTVIITARSISQGEHHTIHLHGLDVDTRNDGDPATSFWLSHGETTTYTFIARHAGSYLYHCHVGDVVHVQMGMYGMIVVSAAGGAKTVWTGGPAFDKEYRWLTSEIDKSWHDNVPKHDTLADTIHLPPYRPNYFLVNGKSRQQIKSDTSISITSATKVKILLRLANIGFYDNKITFPASLQATVVMSDGRPLPNAVRSGTVSVSPGERYEVLLEPKTELIDSVRIQYVNMNTHQVKAEEFVPVTIVSQGVQDLTADEAVIPPYPNPAHDFCIVGKGLEKHVSVTFELVNDIGVKMFADASPFEDGYKLNVRNLPSGTYTVSIRSGKTLLQRIPIIVSH